MAFYERLYSSNFEPKVSEAKPRILVQGDYVVSLMLIVEVILWLSSWVLGNLGEALRAFRFPKNPG